MPPGSLPGDFEEQILVGKLNVDDNPNTATTYGIRGIPTLLIFDEGQPVDQVVGAVPKSVLKKRLEAALAE